MFSNTLTSLIKPLGLAASSLLLLSACNDKPAPVETNEQVTTESELLERINQGGTITVGTEGTYPPFTYHDEQGNLTGYDVEVTRALADKLGINVEFKETQWDAMLTGLDANRFDAVANQVSLSTPERKEKYASTTPYSWSGAVVLAPKSDSRFNAWESLNGLKSAQSLNSNFSDLAKSYGAEVIPVEGMAQAVELVKQQRADFTLNDQLAVLDYLKKFPDSNLEIKLVVPDADKSSSGLVFLKKNEGALPKFDAAMQELQQDGTLAKLSQQFFGDDISKP